MFGVLVWLAYINALNWIFCDGKDGKKRTNISLFDVGKTKTFSLLGDILRSETLKIYSWIPREFKANDVLVYCKS